MNDLVLLLFLALFFTFAISTFLFSRLSVARIKNEIKKDGLPDALMFDLMGGGGSVDYAFAIIVSDKMADRLSVRLIDAHLVRRYATLKDKRRAFAFLISFGMFFVFGLICFFYL
jgi:hypothetical protein